MASVTRVNGIPPVIAGNTVSTSQIALFVIDAGGDLRAEDDAANEVVEAIMMATNAIGSSFADANTGVATLLVDDTQWDAASLQAAVRALGTTVGPNNIDVTGSDVVAATTLTAA